MDKEFEEITLGKKKDLQMKNKHIHSHHQSVGNKNSIIVRY